jgi:hypothetical protein
LLYPLSYSFFKLTGIEPATDGLRSIPLLRLYILSGLAGARREYCPRHMALQAIDYQSKYPRTAPPRSIQLSVEWGNKKSPEIMQQ